MDLIEEGRKWLETAPLQEKKDKAILELNTVIEAINTEEEASVVIALIIALTIIYSLYPDVKKTIQQIED